MGKSVDIHHLGLLLVLRAPASNERLRRLLRLELSKIPWHTHTHYIVLRSNQTRDTRTSAHTHTHYIVLRSNQTRDTRTNAHTHTHYVVLFSNQTRDTRTNAHTHTDYILLFSNQTRDTRTNAHTHTHKHAKMDYLVGVDDKGQTSHNFMVLSARACVCVGVCVGGQGCHS